MERVNQELEDILVAYEYVCQTNQESYLPLLECACRSQKHSTTKFSPFKLSYGVQLAWPYSIGPSHNPSSSEDLRIWETCWIWLREIFHLLWAVIFFSKKKHTLENEYIDLLLPVLILLLLCSKYLWELWFMDNNKEDLRAGKAHPFCFMLVEWRSAH